MFRNSINRGHEFDNNLLWLFKLKTLKAHLSYFDPPLSRRFRNCEPILLKCLVRIRIKSRGKHRGPLDSDELSNDVLSSVFRRYFDLFNFNSQVIDSQCEAFEIFSNPNSLPEWLIKFSTVFLTIVNWVEWLWNPSDSFVICFCGPESAQRSKEFLSFWLYWPIKTLH